MSCNKCGGDLERLTEGVDIGVGTQEFLIGYECIACHWIFDSCTDCGICEDERPTL